MGYKLKHVANIAIKYIAIPMLAIMLASRTTVAGSVQILTTINSLKVVLSQVGPALSAVLFIVAGIFYAVGQMLPPDKKANFHTASINIIIGAIVVGALSVASTSLALASTHLLSNFTNVS
ncbi:MAG: hypothetical protein M1360_03820 [Candidatus Marsarchaeota archaeon]|jgi:hypothetical protein|nr:hypothetical protein [Candidatus Marsarchaeota archaeon]MCL5419040.1 hypothetical protein [Candidatus Marsarchaeota archaeon]